MTEYVVISPDGFTISRDETYQSKTEAAAAARLWLQRYESQGYYSSNHYGRIPLDQVLDYCKIVEAPQEDDTEEYSGDVF